MKLLSKLTLSALALPIAVVPAISSTSCSNKNITITSDYDDKVIETKIDNVKLSIDFSSLPDDSVVTIELSNNKLCFYDTKKSTKQVTIDQSKSFKLNIGYIVTPTVTNKQEFELTFKYLYNKTECVQTKKFSLSFTYEEPLPEALAIVGSEVMYINTTSKFKVVVSPTMASSDVIWSLSDSSYGDLDQSGLFSAKKEGYVDITITSKIVPTIKAIKRVYIEETGLTINSIAGDDSIDLGSTKTYSIVSNPSGHSIYCNWSSSDNTLVDLTTDPTNDHNVIVKAKKGGTVTLTATSKLNNKVTAAKTITLNSGITEIKITGAASIKINETTRYEAEVLPKTVSQSVVWSIVSSTSTGASINPILGELHAGSTAGSVVIRATSSIDSTKHQDFTVTITAE